jgi:2-keto-3-deoxy-L-rhamnonate aldolase RhmA
MLRDSLRETLDAGRSAVGVIALDPYSVEVAAYMGFDWIFIDQMFTALDWSATESLLRCCEAAGVTPVVRVQSNPWLGYDHRIAVDVTRLISIGAQYIVISNSCRKEIEECLEAARNWHRKFWVHPEAEPAELGSKGSSAGVHIIPQPECKEGLAELPDTLQMPGIRMAMIGTTDPSIALGKTRTPNFYAEALWEFIDRAVASTRGRGTVLIANTSWFKTMDDMVERVRHMHSHGIRMPLLQTSYYLMQIGAGRYLKEIKSALAEAK